MLKIHPIRLVMIWLGVLLMLTSTSRLVAQETEIITVYLPAYLRESVPQDAFDSFEEETGYTVQLVDTQEMRLLSTYEVSQAVNDATQEVTYFENARQLASTADVLFFAESQLHPYLTRSGVLLNLEPFLSVDTQHTDDPLLPGMDTAFAWDGGTWALPLTATLELWSYTPDEFDRQGVPYPSPAWQSNDFLRAVEQLTLRNDAGDIIRPAFNDFFNADLIRSFVGEPLYTDDLQRTQPAFTASATETLLPLTELERGNYLGGSTVSGNLPLQLSDVPSALSQSASSNQQIALLPGERAASSAYALAVSSGTQQPEGAYQLVQYLLRQPDFIERMPGDVAAVASVPDQLSSWLAANNDRLSPATVATIETAEQNLITRAETLFVNQSISAVATVAQITDPEPSQMTAALDDVQQQINQTLAAASDAGAETSINVAEPTLAPVLAADEVAINFGIGIPATAVTNSAEWERLAQEFASSNATVGAIDLNFSSQGVRSLTQTTDCFYSPSIQVNNIPASRQTGILPMEPLVTAASPFNRADYLPGVLDQLSRAGQLQALPMTITPTILSIESSEALDQLGETLSTVPTTDTFILLLEDLQGTTRNDDSAVFSAGGAIPDDITVLLLTAAYGGLPIDVTTDPVSFHFDESQTVNALQNVISLMDENYLAYSQQRRSNAPLLLPRQLDRISVSAQRSRSILNFPVGSVYTPVSYTVGGFAISERTTIPEACFQWGLFLSEYPELFNAMPVKAATLEEPTFQQSVSDERLAFYRQYADILRSDDVVNLTTNTLEGWFIGAFVYRIIFQQALQTHLQDEVPLAEVMNRAQSDAEQYRACAAPYRGQEIPIDISNAEVIELLTTIAECAIDVNPELEAFFPFL